MNDFEQMATAKTGGGSAIALFLGLFLLILAFFILLVSISTIENVKSKEVMQSLTSTFADLVMPVTDPTDFTSMHGEVLAPEAFQERITGVFSTAVNVDRIKVIQPGRVMRVDLQAHELFEENKATIRPGRLDMMDRIVASLSANPKNIRFEMAFLVGTAAGDDAGLPTGQTLSMARAGTFARTVIERGAPPNSLSVGIRKGDPSDVTIHFYVREEELARLDFEQDKPVQGLTYDEDDDLSGPRSDGRGGVPSSVIDLVPPDDSGLRGEGRVQQ